jgi:hypothetical protein
MSLHHTATAAMAPHQGTANIVESPYQQLPNEFAAYNCLRCSRSHAKWADCVAHMAGGCCHESLERGVQWGGIEAVRVRCGAAAPDLRMGSSSTQRTGYM